MEEAKEAQDAQDAHAAQDPEARTEAEVAEEVEWWMSEGEAAAVLAGLGVTPPFSMFI